MKNREDAAGHVPAQAHGRKRHREEAVLALRIRPRDAGRRGDRQVLGSHPHRRLAAADPRHCRREGRPDVGPAAGERAGEAGGIALWADRLAERVVVELRQGLAPPERDGEVRAPAEGERRMQRIGPPCGWAERGGRPVVRLDQRAHGAGLPAMVPTRAHAVRRRCSALSGRAAGRNPRPPCLVPIFRNVNSFLGPGEFHCRAELLILCCFSILHQPLGVETKGERPTVESRTSGAERRRDRVVLRCGRGRRRAGARPAYGLRERRRGTMRAHSACARPGDRQRRAAPEKPAGRLLALPRPDICLVFPPASRRDAAASLRNPRAMTGPRR